MQDIIQTDSALMNQKKEIPQHEKMKASLKKYITSDSVEDYFAENLIDVIENAVSPDIKGTLHKDYQEINKALGLLHKAITPQKEGKGGINIALFSPTPIGEDLRY